MDFAAFLVLFRHALTPAPVTVDVPVAADFSGEVDLHTLIADEFLTHHTHEGERLRLDGPVVRLQPRAAQALELAVPEFVVNAVEHGAVGASGGRVAVTWQLGLHIANG